MFAASPDPSNSKGPIGSETPAGLPCISPHKAGAAHSGTPQLDVTSIHPESTHAAGTTLQVAKELLGRVINIKEESVTNIDSGVAQLSCTLPELLHAFALVAADRARAGSLYLSDGAGRQKKGALLQLFDSSGLDLAKNGEPTMLEADKIRSIEVSASWWERSGAARVKLSIPSQSEISNPGQPPITYSESFFDRFHVGKDGQPSQAARDAWLGLRLVAANLLSDKEAILPYQLSPQNPIWARAAHFSQEAAMAVVFSPISIPLATISFTAMAVEAVKQWIKNRNPGSQSPAE
jgi:hypothetical protein